jgi:hypothetical protein
MKALFLAAAVTANYGKTKIILRGVTGGDGLDDFRPGSTTGDTAIDIYGEQTEFEQGKCYLMEITPYDPETATVSVKEPAVAAVEPDPETKEFEGLVTVTTIGGEVLITVKEFTENSATTEEQAAVAEPAKEESTNTQDNVAAPENTAGAQLDTINGLANDIYGSEGVAKQPEGGTADTQVATGTEPAKEGAAGDAMAGTGTNTAVDKVV